MGNKKEFRWRDNISWEYSDSIYALGTANDLSDKNCSYNALAADIYRLENNESEIDPDKQGYQLNLAEISNYFTRPDSGLITQIKKYLNLDVEIKNSDDWNHKKEKLQILYLFFMAINSDIIKNNKYGYGVYWKGVFPKPNILQLLSSPSIENSSYTGYSNTYNGKQVAYLRMMVEKELGEKANIIRKSVHDIVNDWMNVIRDIYDIQVPVSAVESFLDEYNIDEIMKIFKTPYNIKVSSAAFYSPLEQLCLRMIQNEQIGRIKDILYINSLETDPKLCNAIPKEVFSGHDNLSEEIVDIEKYISHNRDELAKYVYKTTTPSYYQKKKLENDAKYLKRILEAIEEIKIIYNKENGTYYYQKIKMRLDKIKLISFLQAIVFNSNCPDWKYTYYGYQNDKKHIPSVKSIYLYNEKDEFVPNVIKEYWRAKSLDHYYANFNLNEVRLKNKEIENAVDELLLKILSLESIEKMNAMHLYYYDMIMMITPNYSKKRIEWLT